MPLHTATGTTYWRHPGYSPEAASYDQEPFVFEVWPVPAPDDSGLTEDDYVCEGEEDEDASTCAKDSPRYYVMTKNDIALMYCAAHAVPEEATSITEAEYVASEEW